MVFSRFIKYERFSYKTLTFSCDKIQLIFIPVGWRDIFENIRKTCVCGVSGKLVKIRHGPVLSSPRNRYIVSQNSNYFHQCTCFRLIFKFSFFNRLTFYILPKISTVSGLPWRKNIAMHESPDNCKMKPCMGKEAQMKQNRPIGLQERQPFFLCMRVCLSLSHSQQVVFSLFRRPITAHTLTCASLPVQGFTARQCGSGPLTMSVQATSQHSCCAGCIRSVRRGSPSRGASDRFRHTSRTHTVPIVVRRKQIILGS